ncbi:hypothetical protein pEaSNUABM6_00228 [Erwinia phage pEa_SNUABM_6]|nr:hypothetical protein pEaSNUABM6_00228 [Erwinia phage pEa_SNUABM_6]
MKLHINLTPSNFEKHWPEMMMQIRESMDAFIHEFTGLPVEDNKLLTLPLWSVLFDPISRLSNSMLTFEFDKTDVEDKRIEKNIEIITLDTKLDSVLEDIRDAVNYELNEFKTAKVVNEALDAWLKGMTDETRGKLRDELVGLVHRHISTLLDVLFAQLTAEIIEISFRFRPRPVMVATDGGKQMVGRISDMIQDVPDEPA